MTRPHAYRGRVIEPVDDEVLDDALVQLAVEYSNDVRVGRLLDEIARVHGLAVMPPGDRVALGLCPSSAADRNELDGLLIELRALINVHPSRSLTPTQARELAGEFVIEAHRADETPGRWSV